MTLEQELIDLFRGPQPSELSRLAARITAEGYQVTILPECDSIYLADPAGGWGLFDTPTGLEVLKKLDIFFTHIHTR